MRRGRKLLALVCAAAIAFAPFALSGAAAGIVAVLSPVWPEFQPGVVLVVHLDPNAPSEQPVCLRALTAFRGPPVPST